MVAALRAAHDELGAAPDDPGLALYFGHQSKSLEYKRAVSDAIRGIVGRRASEVFADHDIYLAIFITKWPGADSGFGPHQDPTLVDERFFRGVTIWIPLVPTGVVDGLDNGMLHVVPGSHRFSQVGRVRNVDTSVFADLDDEIMERGVGVPTQLGEAIVFDNRLIHYSFPNETTEPRLVTSLGMRAREGSCVYVRDNGHGGLDQYAVDDDWFIEVNAAGVDLWDPPYPPEFVHPVPTERMSAERFAALCDTVEPAPNTVPPHRTSLGIAPGAFCAFCGTTEGFEETDRTGRDNAQLLCPPCAEELAAGYAASSDDVAGAAIRS
jgi:hypothetical protein